MKPKSRKTRSPPSTEESPPPRRSKRLREAEEVRRRKSDDDDDDGVVPPSPIAGATPKKYARRGTFPLATLLGLEVPTREHLLPHLSLDDLSALEVVNNDCLDAVRSRRYWKRSFLEFVKNDSLASKIYRKYVRRVSVADSGRGGGGGGTPGRNGDDGDPLYYRRLYTKLKADMQRLRRNVAKGIYKESSVCLPSDCNSVSTDASGRVVFAAGENQVDVFSIAETRKGAALKLLGHVHWEDKLPDYDGVDDNATHAFLAKNDSDWLFVAHYDGLISVWNWKDQSLAHVIKRHVQPDNDLDHYYDIPIITAMEVKQNKLIVGLWSAGPVTVWKFDSSRPSSAVVIASIVLHGYGNVHAVDLDGHLAVVAFERSPWSIHQICVWDLDKNAVSRFITAPDVKTLSINVASGGLLAGSTRIEANAPVLQLFSLNDGSELTSYKTERGDPSDRELDMIEDFYLEGGACVWTDWKERIVLGFTNGVIAFYDIREEEPICCIQRRRFSGNYPCWIKDISFDGTYLIFNHETDVCLFDFLKLTSVKI